MNRAERPQAVYGRRRSEHIQSKLAPSSPNLQSKAKLQSQGSSLSYKCQSLLQDPYKILNLSRYGDPTWTANGQWMQNSAIGLNARSMTRPGFYSERILSSHYTRAAILDRLNEGTVWRSNEHLKQENGLLQKQEPWLGKTRQNPIEIDSLKLQIHSKVHEKGQNLSQVLSQEREKGLKRKALDAGLDLNLSLGVESRNGEDADDEPLVLSLYTVPEPSKDQMKKKKKKEDIVVGDEKARGASTLDLTL